MGLTTPEGTTAPARPYNRYIAYIALFLGGWYLIHSTHFNPGISIPGPYARTNTATLPRTRRVTLEHPIPKLMERAVEKYRDMMGRQSKTLAEAVVEYRRRYKREPPKGFDAWFKYAKERNVKIIDEYDSLVADLEQFWNVTGTELRRRAFQVGHLPSVDLVRIAKGRGYTAKIKQVGLKDREASARAVGFLKMIKNFQTTLPDMDFPINSKSEGRVLVPWEHIHYPNMTNQDSSKGINSMIGGPFVEDWRGEGSVWDAFRRVCPPDTRARRLFASIRGQSNVAQQPQDVLRRDASTAEPHGAEFSFPETVDNEFNFCQKSWGRYYQGHFFSDWRTLPALYPIFSPAKAPGYSDIVIPSHYYYSATKRYTYGVNAINYMLTETDAHEVPWELKKNTIFWRGATTGGGSSPTGFLKGYQRHRLVHLASDKSSTNATVIFPEVPGTKKYITADVPVGPLNKEIFDLAFTTAVGCSQYNPGGCEGMKKDHRFGNAVELSEHWKRKYLVDVDGMGYSARFLAFMASESAVIKATIYKEFFSDWIQPWLHYIPLSQSYAEIYNIHAFFSGPSPSMIHVAQASVHNFTAPPPPQQGKPHQGDALLRQIARAGRHWKQTMTRPEDMETYVYRLCLEWARLWADDRDSMSFVFP